MNKLLYVIASIAALGVFTTSVFAKDLVNVAGASGIALDGYDPVAFFTDNKPMNGDPAISSTHRGATYFFASKEHKVKFEADPQKYVPSSAVIARSASLKVRCFPWISIRGRSSTESSISISIRRS